MGLLFGGGDDHRLGLHVPLRLSVDCLRQHDIVVGRHSRVRSVPALVPENFRVSEKKSKGREFAAGKFLHKPSHFEDRKPTLLLPSFLGIGVWQSLATQYASFRSVVAPTTENEGGASLTHKKKRPLMVRGMMCWVACDDSVFELLCNYCLHFLSSLTFHFT